MITKLVVSGLYGAHKLKIFADVYAGRITSLKIQDLNTHRLLTKYEGHEWILNKIPLYQLENIIHHVLDNLI